MTINVKNLNQYLKNTNQTFAIMRRLGGLMDGTGNDRSQPCPFCGGTNRFRFSADCGKCYCRRCKPDGEGYSVYDVVMHCQDCTFEEALTLVAEASDYTSADCPDDTQTETPQRKPAPIETFETFPLDKKSPVFKAAAKYRSEIPFAIYKRAGAKLYWDGIAIPMYANDGTLSGWVRYGRDNSKRLTPGSKSGIVGEDALDALLQKRSAKVVFKTAGVSDYLALTRVIAEAESEDDLYAFTNGAGEGEIPDKFESILRPALEDKTVVVIADNDDAGTKGAQKWAAFFAKFARSVRIIWLPEEVSGSPVKDLRDYIARLKDNDEDVMEALKALYQSAERVVPNVDTTANESEPPREWRPFPLETLPRRLQRFVIDTSKSIGIDPANVAVNVLSTLSGLIGRTFKIEIKRGYRELAMLWTAVVAPSGYAKSPALDYAREPIIQLEREAQVQYEKDLAAYKAKSGEQQRSPKCKNSAEPIKKPDEPTVRRLSVSDTTTAALLPILAENPFGVCLIRDELAAFFGSMDAYRKDSKMDRQIFIEIHGGRFVQVDRKSGTRYLAANTPSLSITGGIQSDILRRIIKKEPDFLTTGFGARFLVSFPPAVPIFWNDNEVDERAQLFYDKLVRRILSYREHITPDNPGIIALTPKAKKLIFDFQKRQIYESVEVSDGGMRTVLSKAGMHAARLCLNLHVVKCIEGKIDPTSPVTLETMQEAINLTEWFLNDTYRVYAMFAGNDESEDREVEIILVKIRQLGGEATVRDLKPKMSSTSRYRQAGSEELRRKLEEMVEMRLLDVREVGKKTLYCLPADKG